MECMFVSASAFNHDLSVWNVSSITAMSYMFYAASAFNQDLSSTWDVSNLTNMTKMFQFEFAFNQNLCSWASKSPQLLLNASVDVMFLWSSCNNSSTPVLNSGTP
eukprot:scaffold424689_cov204-Attheya_sp.AAC.1